MPQKSVLHADGFHAVFEFRSFEGTNQYLDMLVTFQLDQEVGQVTFSSVPSKIHVDDLRGLEQYLLQHIQQLQTNLDAHSPTFVPLELGFQAEAFSGEVRAPNDGEFTVRLMLNVGVHAREGTRVYLGGEAIVTLSNIYRFITSLRSWSD